MKTTNTTGIAPETAEIRSNRFGFYVVGQASVFSLTDIETCSLREPAAQDLAATRIEYAEFPYVVGFRSGRLMYVRREVGQVIIDELACGGLQSIHDPGETRITVEDPP